jgi:nucleotide-binding universal stress UspA family protein
MYQRILVAVDGSDTSQLALEHALQLGKDQQARIRIVHAIESIHYLVSLSGGYPFDASGLLESLREEGQQVLSRAQAKARSAGVEAETVLLEEKASMDRTAAILVREAKRWDADLIVLGTHGRRGFDRVVLGSVAETLVRIAPLPVLLVRAK